MTRINSVFGHMNRPLAYFPSADISMARILSVCPTSLAVRLPDRGSQVLITLSGVPEATTVPPESTAIAYTEALDPALSGDLREMRGSEPVGDARFKSHSLMVLSKEPDATQFWSRLNDTSEKSERHGKFEEWIPVCETSDIVRVRTDKSGIGDCVGVPRFESSVRGGGHNLEENE